MLVSPRLLLLAFLFALALPGRAGAEDDVPPPPTAGSDPARLDALARELEEQRRANEEMRREIDEIKRREIAREEADRAAAEGGKPAADRPAGAPEKGSIAEKSAELHARWDGAYGGIYAKPFLARFGRASLGGYADWEFRVAQGADKTFRLPRFIPFVYADVTEHVKVAAEIEFEFGGISDETHGEVKLEFAFADYVFAEWIALRAGAILVPLGKFNLIHDSPVNDLTARPLVDRFVIPTTFTEPGIGLYGSFYPGGEWKVDYEIYAVNGFRGLVKDSGSPTGFESRFAVDEGTRDGRPDYEQDVNNSFAGVGRLALSPLLGLEVGFSAHIGNYDEHAGGLLAAIYAVDATIQFGRFAKALGGLELLAEFARADLERNDVARASGVPGGFWGMYSQVNYHFMFDGLRKALPVLFGEESTFTAVLRLDHLDLDGRRFERITPGINFRPTEETVFKVDYEFHFEGGWGRRRIDDDVFSVSIATYF
jgi:hypothetical protein